jgi:hypothetical protein
LGLLLLLLFFWNDTTYYKIRSVFRKYQLRFIQNNIIKMFSIYRNNNNIVLRKTKSCVFIYELILRVYDRHFVITKYYYVFRNYHVSPMWRQGNHILVQSLSWNRCFVNFETILLYKYHMFSFKRRWYIKKNYFNWVFKTFSAY